MAIALTGAQTWPQEPVRDGGEFQVSSATLPDQRYPEVAMADDGSFVVAWAVLNPNWADQNVWARRFDASGVPLTPDLPVNSVSATARWPDVASDAAGNFVVVWDDFPVGTNGNSGRMLARRFDAAGTALGTEFQVNTYTGNSPRVAMQDDGNFLVVWWGAGETGQPGAFGQRFDSLGVPEGPQFRISADTGSQTSTPDIDLRADGGFVAVWHELIGSEPPIFGRLFDAGANPLGAPFSINTYYTANTGRARVAADPAGNFLVTWSTYPSHPSQRDVVGRRFDAGGAPLGPEFRINTYTFQVQTSPEVISTDGGFVVVWQGKSQETGGRNYGVWGQAFDSAGNRAGAEFHVNTFTGDDQKSVAIAGRGAGGRFVVAWQSSFQDGGGLGGVFGQRYVSDLIFRDGFESGNLTQWSAAETDGGDLAPAPAAAMRSSTVGLQASVDDPTRLIVRDDTSLAEDRYRVRFYLGAHDFDPGEASGRHRVRIFAAFDDAQLRVVTLVLSRMSGQYAVQGRVFRSDRTRADTPFLPITNGPHAIEMDWRRASSTSAADGAFEMWIDGVPVAALASLDNHAITVSSVRLGPFSVKAGATGTLYFDEFESRRVTYIGP